MGYIKTSIEDLIIAFLSSARNSRRFHEIIRQREIARYQEASVSVTLSRMRKKGCVLRTKSGWMLTNAKEESNSSSLLSYIPSPFTDTTPSNTIIAFDIPERDRRIRDWLRNQLKVFNYKMVQKSLWRGPGPLPQEFKRRISELGVKDRVKLFTMAVKRRK